MNETVVSAEVVAVRFDNLTRQTQITMRSKEKHRFLTWFFHVYRPNKSYSCVGFLNKVLFSSPKDDEGLFTFSGVFSYDFDTNDVVEIGFSEFISGFVDYKTDNAKRYIRKIVNRETDKIFGID